jgi:SNF2 family DNA or RNA helicase
VRGDREARRITYASARRGDLLLLTYPTVSADIAPLQELAQRLSLMLIVDESHRVKRFRGGLWAEAMQRLARVASARLILTGTPMPQGPEDLYSQLQVLWPDGQLTGSRSQFQSRALGNFDGLVREISPFFVRTGKDELGIPPYTVTRHPVEMSDLQGEVYDLIRSRFQRRLADALSWQDKIATLRRARPMRLIQAASNPDLLNAGDGYFRLPQIDSPGATLMSRLAEYRQRELPAKFAAVIAFIRERAEQGEKTVVWTSFVRNIDQLSQLVRLQLGLPTWSVDGRVPTAVTSDDTLRIDDPGEEIDVTREQRIRSFLTDDRVGVLVANPAACGESISLHTACTTAIYLDRTYDAARYLQSIDRIHRLGLPDDARVEVHIFEALLDGAPTVDGLVDLSLSRKQTRMEQLLQGAALLPAQLPEAARETEAAEGDQQDLQELLAYLLGR